MFLRVDDPVWRKVVRTAHGSERRFVAMRRRTRPRGVCFDTARGERIRSASFTAVNEHQ
jgi:hypothetical protein